MMLSVCLCIVVEVLIKHLLNHHKGYQVLGFIVTMQIQIAASMHSHICLLYTDLLTVFKPGTCWSVHAWFLKIVSVWMSVCVSAPEAINN